MNFVTRNYRAYYLMVCILPLFASCDFLFGSKEDDTVNEIFEQGAIDPDLYPDQAGYVPMLPFWESTIAIILPPNPADRASGAILRN